MLVIKVSLSPRRGSFEDGHDNELDADAICPALTDVASSSNNNPRSSGWTSSEDEEDIMDQDDEGLSLLHFFRLSFDIQ